MYKSKIKNSILVSFCVFLLHFQLNAQEKGLILSKYYSPLDYKAGVQNWAIVQDQRGVMYFGNAAGVLEYDGVNWNLMRVDNNSAVRCLAFNNQNTLFAGAFGEMGYFLPDDKGFLKYHSLLPKIEIDHSTLGEVWDINCFSDSVFFLTDRYLFLYSSNKFKHWESEKERFYLTYKVNNDLYLQEIGTGLLKYKNDSLKLVEGGEAFANIRIHSIFPVGKNRLLICTRFDGLFIYENDGSKMKITSFNDITPQTKALNDYFIKHSFYHGTIVHNNQIALGSITKDILIVDDKWNVVDVINSKSIGLKASTLFLYYQENQSLWLALDNGISQVEIDAPFRYWNEEIGLQGTLADVAALYGNIYVSTSSGVYYASKNNQKSPFETTAFCPVNETFEQSWGFLYFHPPVKDKKLSRLSYIIPEKDSKLLIAAGRGIFEIKGPNAHKIASSRSAHRLYQYRKDPSKLFFCPPTGIHQLSYSNGDWTETQKMFGIEDLIRDIKEDSIGNLWLIAPFKGVYLVENPTASNNLMPSVHLYDTSSGLPSVQFVEIFDRDSGLLFISDRKYHTFDATKKKFIEYKPDKNSVEEDTISWYRIYNELISDYYITDYHDSCVWFGTTKGIFRYNGALFRNYYKVFPAIIRKIMIGDSTIYYGTNFISEKRDSNYKGFNKININPRISLDTILPYKENSLSFYYAWPFFEDESQNLYSCFLEGYDQEWSTWTTETKKAYTNLPGGEYVFKVKAKNLYQIESDFASFAFEILPPWYGTIWAYLGYLIVLGLFVILVVKIYTYRLLKEKENLERIVKERTQEILMQNEEIMVQAEHLKEANEWISAKNIELESQKKEIEKKRDQLEMSNATKNKFFRIIAHDLRSPMSTFLNSTSYILTDLEDFSKEKTKKFISDLNKLSQTTYNLLENLLDWSTSQMGEIKFNPRTIDITGIIKENIELIRNRLDSKKIKLTLDLPHQMEVFGDENMIHTVIRNLISNAAKFTYESGEIKISCKAEGNICKVCISDNGIGINKENIDKLFRIDQHHTTLGTQNEKGSGLGLILCKEFVEQNGGTITVTSELGKGSTFCFSLNLP